MPQSLGSGAAVLDYDQDGRLDILLLQGAGPDSPSKHTLYHQDQDGTFRDVSRGSGLDFSCYGTGVAVGDVNNDGFPDVLIGEYGGLRLLLNKNGTGRFEDISDDAGIASPYWTTSCAFLDFDRDGWLDIVAVNYVAYNPGKLCYTKAGRRNFCGPNDFPGTPTLLFRNVGKQPMGRVRFENVTAQAGLQNVPGPGLGVLCADFDGDGWDDIFVANDGQPNRLWINQKDGTFRNEAFDRGVAYNAMGNSEGDMGVAIGDVDGDGLFDLFATHLVNETHTLWAQGPRGRFQDRTSRTGLAAGVARSTGFGTVLEDFDNDGDLDVAIVNGRVYRDESSGSQLQGSFWVQFAQPNGLFANDGRGRFRSVAPKNPDFCSPSEVSRGLVCGDLDNDGGIDLLVTNISAPARLYRNVAKNRGSFLIVRAVDPSLSRDAYGAVVTVEADGYRRARTVNPGYSYQCSNDPRVHFGLGNRKRIDRISVKWPGGEVETFAGGLVNRIVTVVRGKGERRR